MEEEVRPLWEIVRVLSEVPKASPQPEASPEDQWCVVRRNGSKIHFRRTSGTAPVTTKNTFALPKDECGSEEGNSRRGGRADKRQEVPQQRQTTTTARRSARQDQAAGTSQDAQQRVPEIQALANEGDQPRNQRNSPQQRKSRGNSTSRRSATRQRGGRGDMQARSATQSRAPVVSLDGASSSESDGEWTPQQTPKKVARKAIQQREENKEDLHITLSPDKMSRGIMSDSSDSEDEAKLKTVATPSRTPVAPQTPQMLNNTNNSSSGSSDEDIFGLDYSVCTSHALKGALKEIKSTEVSQPAALVSLTTPTKKKPVHTVDSDDDCVIEECPVDYRKRQRSGDSPDSPPSSPVLFDIVHSEELNQNSRSNRGRKKRLTGKCRSVLVNDSLFDLSSDIILSDEEEEVNPEMQVRIKWGSESFRLPIRKWQKFSHMYEALGKKYGVSADRVVLNLKDKIIDPADCPGDLKVTIADCIEGGIQSVQSTSSNHRVQGEGRTGVLAASKDPNSILLRVQNSDRKGSVTISLGLTETMSVLMHKYAEEKQLSMEKLQFWFDGELLNPRSTPNSLDMEGGECIDVYKVT